MDEVDVGRGRRPAGFKYTWATEHHFLTSTRTSRPTRCSSATSRPRRERIHLGSGIFNITPPVNHPARVAERVAMLDHLSEGRFEFGMGRGSSTTEQARLRHRRPRAHHATCSTRSIAEFRRCGRDERVLASTASSSRCRRATCCRSRTRSRTRRCGSRPATRRRSRRPARMGLGVLCFTIGGRPRRWRRSSRRYKKEIANAEPVGDFVNDNIMVTTSCCASRTGSGRATSVPT